jgi:homoserine dehydrogenase
MGDRGVSIESIVQRRPRSALPGTGTRSESGAPTTVVMITHETTEESIRQAIEAIEQDGQVSERPQVIRIEKLNEEVR